MYIYPDVAKVMYETGELSAGTLEKTEVVMKGSPPCMNLVFGTVAAAGRAATTTSKLGFLTVPCIKSTHANQRSTERRADAATLLTRAVVYTYTYGSFYFVPLPRLDSV